MKNIKIQMQYKKPVSVLLILAMFHLCWLTSYGWAEMVATDAVAPSPTENLNPRQRLIALVNREDVQKELEKHGLSRGEAVARIHSLTDDEVAQVMAKVDQLPNGGSEGDAIAAAVYLGLLAALLATVLALYLLGVFFKALNCLSDCEAKGGWGYVFKPWWKGLALESPESSAVEPEDEDDYNFSHEDGY